MFKVLGPYEVQLRSWASSLTWSQGVTRKADEAVG